MIWTDTDLAYFAGIIDGEGNFCLHNQGTHVFSCSLSVGNTDPRLAQWLMARFGGRLHRQQMKDPRCKLFYRWSLASRDITPMITAVLPYLVLKKDQAELMLAYRKTIVPRGGMKRVKNVQVMREVDTLHRQALHAKMSLLNKRGA